MVDDIKGITVNFLRCENGIGLYKRMSLHSDAKIVSREWQEVCHSPSRSSAKRERKTETEKTHNEWYQFPNHGKNVFSYMFLYSEQFSFFFK